MRFFTLGVHLNGELNQKLEPKWLSYPFQPRIESLGEALLVAPVSVCEAEYGRQREPARIPSLELFVFETLSGSVRFGRTLPA